MNQQSIQHTGAMQTGDIRLIKNINERVVLNLIRENKLISGADLAKATGMRPSTIAKLLKLLESKSLILNRGKGESTNKGGKRPFLWSLNSKVGYTVGVELGTDHAVGVLLDLEGNMVQKNVYSNRPMLIPNDLSDLAMHAVSDLSKAKGVDLSKILGLGVGIAGIVDSDKGRIEMSDSLSHSGVPLRAMLEEHYDFPVFIENNANAAAMGEKWLGRGRGVENFIIAVVYLDRGIGGLGVGIVLKNEIFKGANFAAGETNVRLIPLDMELRSHRNRLAEGHILKNYVNALEKLNIRFLVDAAKKKDKFAIDYFRKLGYQIGRKMSCAISLINPEKLIIQGEVAELNDLITEPIKSAIELDVHHATSSNLLVESGFHGRYSVSIGAAAIILNDIFQMPSVISNSISSYFE